MFSPFIIIGILVVRHAEKPTPTKRRDSLPTGFDLLGFAKQKDGQEIMVRPSLDGQYHLVVTAPPPLRFGPFLPYFFAVAIAIALLVGLCPLELLRHYIASETPSIASAEGV